MSEDSDTVDAVGCLAMLVLLAVVFAWVVWGMNGRTEARKAACSERGGVPISWHACIKSDAVIKLDTPSLPASPSASEKERN
jgi:hypothetical protein